MLHFCFPHVLLFSLAARCMTIWGHILITVLIHRHLNLNLYIRETLTYTHLITWGTGTWRLNASRSYIEVCDNERSHIILYIWSTEFIFNCTFYRETLHKSHTYTWWREDGLNRSARFQVRIRCMTVRGHNSVLRIHGLSFPNLNLYIRETLHKSHTHTWWHEDGTHRSACFQVRIRCMTTWGHMTV